MLDLTQTRPVSCAHDSLRPARPALLTHLLGESGQLNLDASDPISGALLAGQNVARESVAAA